MEEYIVGHDNLPKPSLFQMNSSNILNNMASLEGFNMSFQEIMSYDDDHMLGSNAPVFDHVMPHFFPEIAVNSSPSTSGTIGFLDPHKINKKHQEENQSGKKRKRSNERETQKEKEVVHVRAKRGQATDSHSLAERLRREKINDKLRCLQDLVPGCYKTMGMAVMLDVIINYVRSLQDQIDFLSMKLSAASLFYDFNSSEAEAMEALQGTSGYEGGQVMEKVVGDGYGEIPQFQSAAWPL